jgi:hypothetical protein
MNLKKVLLVAALAVGATGVALAASDGPRGGDGERVEIRHRAGPGGHGGHFSVEHVAMHNIMADLLSARTGKTPAEIQALFEKGGPHEAFEQLGLDEDEVRPLFKEARLKLIDRSAKAGLITTAQAEKLKSARIDMRHKRRHRDGGDDHGDDEDRRNHP